MRVGSLTRVEKFQSTPPRGRRPVGASKQRNRWKFQSTPPRGRRREAGPPAWGAENGFQSTPPRGRRRDWRSPGAVPGPVSIHASAREATDEPPEAGIARLRVSIHASAREATAGATSSATSASCFNPRLRAGGDPGRRAEPGRRSWMFQSTPPRGRRPDSSARPLCPRRGFNPRLRAGGDPLD